MAFRSLVLGCGGYLPDRIVTNAELAERLDTSDEWIVQRTGIRQRHIAAPGELTSDLALHAAARALAAAGCTPADIDLVVLATATPDNTFPATAAKVAARLGVKAGNPAFDVQAVCTGFIYALAVADNFLRCGQAKRALVIGAETFSRILDWQDRGTCVLFGDGAGAVVIEAQPSNGSPLERGILSTHLHADGAHYNLLFVDGGPSTTGSCGLLRMEGREIFRHAVHRLAEVVDEALAVNGFSADDVDWLVPHQANRRIIDGMGRKLGLAAARVVVTIDRHANTSAASVPLALAEAAGDGRIRAGQLVMLEAMGGGLTWGAAFIRW
ncbi:MAG TPA: beta-ketoacyl-ACP synthase III [Stellaceae bacterium]|nr:beta-ketoacyl-ACP synthase III [Stellaceae bacterium]